MRKMCGSDLYSVTVGFLVEKNEEATPWSVIGMMYGLLRKQGTSFTVT